MSNTSDFSKPQTTDTYVNVTAEVNAIAADLAKGLDPATSTPANLPANTVRWNSANGFWEKFTGTTWNALASVYNIVAAQANKLKNAVTISITGDVAGSTSFDGSGNVSITATMPTLNSNPGTVGSSTVVPVITTNAKGQVTAVAQAGINFPAAPVSSVFGRTGAVVLGSGDVSGALGYTPFNAASAAGKLDNSGGTMTGNLNLANGAVIYSSQAGAADNARNTGYKMNDGQDIGEMGRSNQYYDDLATNCNGYLPTGNCASNANWTPPNVNWWTWGLGFNYCANAAQYDGVGGTTYANNAVPSVALNYDGYYLAQDEIGGGEYHRWYRACNCNCNCGTYTNCNCGATAFNCRTNCNCNCNCACCGSC